MEQPCMDDNGSDRLSRDNRNPFNREQPWDDSGEQVLQNIAEESSLLSSYHQEAGYYFKKMYNRFSPPTIYLPLLLTIYTTVLAIYNPAALYWQTFAPVMLGIISGFTSYLHAKQFEANKEKSFNFACLANELTLDINFLLEGIHRDHRIQYDVFLERVKMKWVNLLKQQPVLPGFLYQRFLIDQEKRSSVRVELIESEKPLSDQKYRPLGNSQISNAVVSSFSFDSQGKEIVHQYDSIVPKAKMENSKIKSNDETTPLKCFVRNNST